MKQEHQISPLNLDKMMKVIEIKAWISFATVIIILVSIMIWGFFGTVQIRTEVTGVLVKSGKIVNICAEDDYTLLDFSIAPDMFIEKYQTVARAEQLELVSKINIMIAESYPSIEIEAAREELIRKSQIMSPESGRVVNTYVNSGDYVSKGTKLATISQEARDGKAMECLLFIPAEKIKDIQKGMKVNIYPMNVKKQTYGSMTGVVSTISEYPVTEQYMFGILGSEELAKEFLKEGACYEVYINLATSEKTVTGYEWTTSMGPSKKFGDLTLCDAAVIIGESSPKDIFFSN